MRFEIRYPTGSPHQVDLQGTLITLGRDPGCDLVLSDLKCSRRHAVVEAGPKGLTIRDTGSANGVFVNAKKVERASLEPGDLIRVGEVILKVLPEEITGTLVMGPEEQEHPLAEAGTKPAPVKSEPRIPPAPAPRSGPRPVSSPRREPPEGPRTAGARRAPARPLTVTLLGALWLLSIVLFLGGGLVMAARAGWTGLPLAAAGLGIALALLAVVMGFGLLTLQPWARPLQIGIAGLGLLVCPFSLASATVLFYMLREDARLYFSGRPVPAREESAQATEVTFALSLLAMVAVGAALTALGLWFAFARRGAL